jgi:hypothetical protein
MFAAHNAEGTGWIFSHDFCLKVRHAALVGLMLARWASSSSVPTDTAYSKWSHGPLSDPGFFPLAVWLQSPAKAERYRKAGFNTYIGLWKGPTEEQLAQLKSAGMRLICEQNAVSLKHLEDPTIIGWMRGDEPDDAQPLGAGQGWGAPIPPEKVVEIYERIRRADPTRPVLLNLGQGVAWDKWYGRGSRSNHPEDYPKYIEGCDIVSYDIYPVVHDNPDVADKLWLVPYGVERLRVWTAGRKIVWNCLECTRISNPDRKPTPQQVRCEAWMSLIHSSHGLIFFVHEFKPKFREAALLDDPEMLEAISSLNRQIAELAPVLNQPSTEAMPGMVGQQEIAQPDNSAVALAVLVKNHDQATYVLAVAMRPGTTTAQFRVPGLGSSKNAEVLGENRSVPVTNGMFKDVFGLWDVHLYRIKESN